MIIFSKIFLLSADPFDLVKSKILSFDKVLMLVKRILYNSFN